MRGDDFAIWRLMDRAAGHFILAHLGGHSREARANLYALASGFLLTASGLLLDRAEAMEEQNPAEAMVEKAFGR